MTSRAPACRGSAIAGVTPAHTAHVYADARNLGLAWGRPESCRSAHIQLMSAQRQLSAMSPVRSLLSHQRDLTSTATGDATLQYAPVSEPLRLAVGEVLGESVRPRETRFRLPGALEVGGVWESPSHKPHTSTRTRGLD